MLKKTIKQKQKKLNKNNKTDVQKRTYKIDSCKIFLKFHKKTALPFSGHILRSMDMQGQQSQSLNRLSIQAIFLEIKNVQETISKKIDQIPDPINFVIITISQNFDHPGCHARSLVSFQNFFYQKKVLLNTRFYLLHVFLYLVHIWKYTDHIEFLASEHFMQCLLRDVFRTLSNVYDGVFFRKQLKAKSC